MNWNLCRGAARLILGASLVTMCLPGRVAAKEKPKPAATAQPTAPPTAPPTPAGPPLLSRVPAGTQKLTGLAAVIAAGVVPQWPVELTAVETLQRRCEASACNQWERIDLALGRAGQWMAAFPTESLRFDAAVNLSSVRRVVDSEALRGAFARARLGADRDDDHPQRRFWIPDFTSPETVTSRWAVPTEPGQRVNPNNVLHEALFCHEYGWRKETTEYICGVMRDGGGYETTHGLWGLAIADEKGCVPKADYERCVRVLQRELAEAQPAKLEPDKTLDIDLYAERLVMSVVTGFPDPIVNEWVRNLLALQGADGSWGVANAGEEPYFRYHTTNIVAWALAEWFKRVVEHAEARPQ